MPFGSLCFATGVLLRDDGASGAGAGVGAVVDGALENGLPTPR